MKSNIFLLAVLLLMPSMGSAVPLTITSMPTDSTGGDGAPLRHNVFHAATGPGGMSGDVLAWFDLNNSFTSTWDPDAGVLDLYVNVYADAAQTTLLGTATGTSTNLFGAGFGDYDNTLLAFINWEFDGGAAAAVGTSSLVMEFIDHLYSSATNSAGNVPNTYVGNTLTFWGADGTHNGNGGFDGATMGVDMVFNVPEPGILLLLAVGLLGVGASVRRPI
ncbi:MAG: PEP-CTERM sorting domain-containing protein [Gammaproteobacteria bacterium]|nr:PEP-CTERM sorting domain-containing protein [Gammaproteobacteria bacterium]